MLNSNSNPNPTRNGNPGVSRPSQTNGPNSVCPPSAVEPIKSRLRSGAKPKTVDPQIPAKRVSFTGLPSVPKLMSRSSKKALSNTTTNPVKKKVGNNKTPPSHHKTPQSQDASSQTDIIDNTSIHSNLPDLQSEIDTNTWVQMKEGLLNKIIEQEKEILNLREKIGTLENVISCKNATRKVEDGKQTFTAQSFGDQRADGFYCYITGDSHVRGLSQELLTILPGHCHPQSFFRPGADFHSVANLHLDSPNLVDPAPEDCVVLMCGTADVCNTQWDVILKAVDTLITKFQRGKLICVVGVPLRFDRKKINFHIRRFNLKLKSYLESQNQHGLQFLDPNKFLKLNSYNRDRLHLNNQGKAKLCNKIASLIRSRLNIQNSSPISPSYNRPTDKCDKPSSSVELLPLVPTTIINGIPNNLSSEDVTTIVDITHDLIDLTDPCDEQVSYFSSVISSNNVLFPEPVVTNDSMLDSTFTPLDLSVVPRTPISPPIQLADKSQINTSNFYHLTHVSLSSFSNNAVHSSPLVSLDQAPNPIFHRGNKPDLNL